MRIVQLAAEEGPFNPFRVSDFALFFWVLIAFIAVLYVLARRVFPKLEETLADRKRQIQEDLEKAEQTRQEAERILEDYKARVAQAREEANRVADEIRETAQNSAKEIIAKTEAEARLIFDKSAKELVAEKERTIGELQQQLAQWSADIAGKIVQKELSPQAHNDLVESFIREVQKGNGG